MTCNCNLCAPWNTLAKEYDDEERLNEIKAQRLAVHGLKPAVLTMRHVEDRDGRVVVRDEAFDLAKPDDRERLQQMIFDARQADIEAVIDAENDAAGYELPMPSFQPHDYSTPFMRAVLKDQEQERLREYLRSRL